MGPFPTVPAGEIDWGKDWGGSYILSQRKLSQKLSRKLCRMNEMPQTKRTVGK